MPPVGILIDPTTQSTLYSAFDSSAEETDIYKSTDWGVTWTFLQSMPILADLELDPQNPSTLYASSPLPGTVVIYKSTDGGVTWNEADSGILAVSGTKGAVLQLAVDPVNEGVVYAADRTSGLYKSTDGGQSWTSIDSGIDTLVDEDYYPTQLMVDSSHTSTVYFSVSAIPPEHGHPGLPVTVPSGLYKSTDGGATWNAAGLAGIGISAAAMDPANSSHLVACAYGTFESSTDGGATWTAGASCVGSYVSIAISDTNPNQIFIGYETSSTVWESDDGGATFNSVEVLPNEFRGIAYRSGNVYVGAYYSGLYISRDSGATWIASSSAASPQTINVPTEEPTIQAAIDAASNGDTVLVSPGTYYEKLDFEGKAITLASSGGAAATILDGNGGGPIVNFHTSEGNASVLQGFTLTHAEQNDIVGYGPAINIDGSSPTIEDNIFVDNIDGLGLGGAIAGNGASPIIVRNYFTGNSGLNYAPNPFCVIGFVNVSSPVVADNVFANNSVIAYYQLIPSPSPSPKFYNNTVVGNTAGLDLSFASNSASMLFSNNVIAFNQIGVKMSFSNGATLPAFNDNLVYGSTTSDYNGVASQTGSNDNISSDPQLKNWSDGDVHLLYGSPAIDVGDSAVNQASVTDFYGNTRVYAGNPGGTAVVDIGAAEYEPPVVTAAGGSILVPFDGAKSGTLASAEADPSEPLVFALVTPPAHGTVTLMNAAIGTFQYTPAQGYLGADSFTFHITDPYGTVSSVATEQVTVAYVAATANNGSVTTKPDTVVSGSLSATTDYPGQTLSFSIVSNPTHGTVSVVSSSGSFHYVPAMAYVGADSFTFEATDSHGTVSNVATESVTVTDVAPKANAMNVQIYPIASGSRLLSGSTVYAGQVLTYELVSQPAHGAVTITNAQTGAYTYTVDYPFTGKDSFTFQVVDQWGTASNVATVSTRVF